MRDLSSLTRDQNCTPAIEAWRLNLWTTRKFPLSFVFLASNTIANVVPSQVECIPKEEADRWIENSNMLLSSVPLTILRIIGKFWAEHLTKASFMDAQPVLLHRAPHPSDIQVQGWDREWIEWSWTGFRGGTRKDLISRSSIVSQRQFYNSGYIATDLCLSQITLPTYYWISSHYKIKKHQILFSDVSIKKLVKSEIVSSLKEWRQLLQWIERYYFLFCLLF